jgi:hypothetical protein
MIMSECLLIQPAALILWQALWFSYCFLYSTKFKVHPFPGTDILIAEVLSTKSREPTMAKSNLR